MSLRPADTGTRPFLFYMYILFYKVHIVTNNFMTHGHMTYKRANFSLPGNNIKPSHAEFVEWSWPTSTLLISVSAKPFL